MAPVVLFDLSTSLLHIQIFPFQTLKSRRPNPLKGFTPLVNPDRSSRANTRYRQIPVRAFNYNVTESRTFHCHDIDQNREALGQPSLHDRRPLETRCLPRQRASVERGRAGASVDQVTAEGLQGRQCGTDCSLARCPRTIY